MLQNSVFPLTSKVGSVGGGWEDPSEFEVLLSWTSALPQALFGPYLEVGQDMTESVKDADSLILLLPRRSQVSYCPRPRPRFPHLSGCSTRASVTLFSKANMVEQWLSGDNLGAGGCCLIIALQSRASVSQFRSKEGQDVAGNVVKDDLGVRGHPCTCDSRPVSFFPFRRKEGRIGCFWSRGQE